MKALVLEEEIMERLVKAMEEEEKPEAIIM